MSQRFRTMNHGTVTAVRRLGHGAAAEVWTIAERKDLVLKVYKETPPQGEEAKMRDLIAAGFPTEVRGFPHLLAAWPQDIAFNPSGAMLGLLVPRASGSTKFSVLALPREREKLASNLSYERVLRWVHGACVLTSFAHHHGVVLCDANGRNFLGGGRGSVSLIDLDSVQFTGLKGRLWHSPWFSPDYLAPELYGTDLRKVTRTAAHDDFAIFVLAFEMIFCGRGPFDGVHRDPDSTPSLRARNGQFAYAGTAADFKPPPMAPSWSIVGPELAAQFRSAFTAGASGASRRPTVKDLGDGIAATLAQLVTCQGLRTHFYPKSARSCPWCSYEQRIGLAQKAAPPPGSRAARKARASALRPKPTKTTPPAPSQGGNGAKVVATALAIALFAALVLVALGSRGGASAGSAGTEERSEPARTATSPPPSPPPVEAAPEPTAAHPRSDLNTRADDPAGSLRRHFRLLDRHRPEAAFRLFVPSYRAAVDSWVAERRIARPRLRIVRIQTRSRGGGTALVEVLFYSKDTVRVPASDRHCRRFSGTVHLRHIDDAWFYDPEAGALTSAVVSGNRCR